MKRLLHLLLLPAFLFPAVHISAQESPDKPNDKPSAPQPAETGTGSTPADTNPAHLKSDKSLGDTLDLFFSALKRNEIEKAFDRLPKSRMIAEDLEYVIRLKKDTKRAIDLFGAIQGYEIIQIQPAGTRLLRFIAVSFGKEMPLRWRLTFYRSENEWKLVDLRIDDGLTYLFDDPGHPAPAQPNPAKKQ